MNAELGRRILERYFLEPGETVLEVSDIGQALIFSTNTVLWRIDLVEAISPEPNPAFAIYHVAIDIRAEPPSPPDGIAVLPDGAFFHLNEVAEFRAFWLRVRKWTSPVELAVFLAHYLSDSPAYQRPVLNEEDMAWLLDDHQVESIPDFVLPQSRIDDMGGMTLDFCSYFLAQEPPDNLFKVSLNRWHVMADARGHLEWSTRSIAEGIESPRYSRPT